MLRYHIPSEFNYENATLREKIQYHLRMNGMKQLELAVALGIDKAHISRLISGRKKFTLEQIEKITDFLNLRKYELFNDFVNEEFIDENGKIKKTKCEEFLVKCAEINSIDLINKTASMLYEFGTKNLNYLFKAAEDLYGIGQYSQAKNLYVNFTERAKNKLNNRLAVSYFKLFMIARKEQIKNRTSVKEVQDRLVILKDYIEVLPLEIKMECYIEISVFYNSKEDFENVVRYSNKAIDSYNNAKSEELKRIDDYTKYIADGLLFLAFGFRGLGMYDEAISTFHEYAKVRETSKNMAEGNKLLVQVLKGNYQAITDYLKWATSLDDKISIVHIGLESFIKRKQYGKITDFLNQYSDFVDVLFEKTDMLNMKYKLRVVQYLVEYLFEMKMDSLAIDFLLHGMELSAFLENKTRYNRCWHLFTVNYKSANTDQIDRFNNIVNQNN